MCGLSNRTSKTLFRLGDKPWKSEWLAIKRIVQDDGGLPEEETYVEAGGDDASHHCIGHITAFIVLTNLVSTIRSRYRSASSFPFRSYNRSVIQPAQKRLIPKTRR